MNSPTILLSLSAGVLSFLSPCILPLIPSYLSYVGGVTLTELRESNSPKGAVVVRTILFVIGFSVVFIVLGVLFAGTGFLFSNLSSTINLVAGLIVVLLGANMIFDFWKFLNIEKRVHLSGRPAGYLGSVLVGMAFGAGWTPCVGPILAAILFLAGNSGSVGEGVLYLSAYSVGLGLPFLLASLFFRQVTARLSKLKRYFGVLRVASGLLLVGIGLLIAFGRLQQFNNTVAEIGVAVHGWHVQAPDLSRLVFGFISAAIALLFLVPGLVAMLRSRSGDVETAPAPARQRLITPVRGVFLGLFGITALLQFAGVISLAEFIYRWFTFQGI
jgi:cytochrome c-type biogenesis protein